MEGIYGSILKQVFPRVTTLIWLDISDDECVSNLIQRGQTAAEQRYSLKSYWNIRVATGSEKII